MVPYITITSEEFETASANFAAMAGKIRELLKDVKSEVKRIESVWDGADQDPFFMNYREMAKTLDQLPEVIAGISYELREMAQMCMSCVYAAPEYFCNKLLQ